jgi:tubulin polyglutamylase TTLL5
VLPKEYVAFLEAFSELEEKEGQFNYWIMKPAAKSRGRGISLMNDISQLTYGEPMVMQKYIKNPLLLNGYKFDLRVYVLVTSVNPLEVFIYREGFGRFSTVPYTLDPNDKANKFVHLTNYSINKYNMKNYELDAKEKEFGGSKVSFSTLRKTFNDDLKVDWDSVIWT